MIRYYGKQYSCLLLNWVINWSWTKRDQNRHLLDSNRNIYIVYNSSKKWNEKIGWLLMFTTELPKKGLFSLCIWLDGEKSLTDLSDHRLQDSSPLEHEAMVYHGWGYYQIFSRTQQRRCISNIREFDSETRYICIK